MRNKYATAEEITNKFLFLEDYGLVLYRKETLNYGAYIEFKGNGIKVYLGFDYRDYYFNFLIYNGEDLKYSDAAYGKDIRSFCDLAKKYKKGIVCCYLQPSDNNSCEQALNNNVSLLKEYGTLILKGKEWF